MPSVETRRLKLKIQQDFRSYSHVSAGIAEKIAELLKTSDQIRALAIQTLEIEAEALHNLTQKIGENFVQSVQTIYRSEGRVVVTGIGKSAIIANKIVATLNSTGTPAVFMHAADAIHGDLGNIQHNDVVLALSNSGNTPEVKVLIPLIRQMGNTLIGMTGHPESMLGREADLMLDTSVHKEACPNGLAPTTSTTAQLAMGDALAVCLLEMRDFSAEDFARYHPGGALGKKLYLRVAELAEANAKPQVAPDADLKTVILEISSNRLGATAVVEGDALIGIVTDGDLRRMLAQSASLEGLCARDLMTVNPKTIEADALAVEAVKLLKDKNISQAVVVRDGGYAGFIHFHDLLREGLI